jgi:HK97 family phage prohead protease
MTAIATEISDPGLERVVIQRSFSSEFEVGDGRTVIGRCVPYNVPALVRDGGGPLYREMFLPRAFQAMSRAPDRLKRITLDFRHGRALTDLVGKCVELNEADDALYAHFEMFDDADGNKALSLVRDGVLTGMSVEADAIKSTRGQDGIVRRSKARLIGVALVREGSYVDAEVVAIREAAAERLAEVGALSPLDPVLARRLGRHVTLPSALTTDAREA